MITLKMIPAVTGWLLSLFLMVGGIANAQINSSDIEINFKRYKLDNGLTLLVHEDHKAPIVTVNIWYHVGSKDEPKGKTGFAHLFEHLMFNGSENFNKDWFLALEKLGGTDLNGTTFFDRTNYFQTVPNTALDSVLWLESDRMGHFLGVLDQARLDEQRGVVQNEKRQGENQPYGRSWEVTLKGLFAEGHPYRWTTIGSMEDLDAASLEDVKTWFETYYGAANAVLVVAGDVTSDEVFEKVKRYFGSIPSGPALEKSVFNIGKRTQSKRDRIYDQVAQARFTKMWNTPQFGTKDDVLLQLAASVLGGGKSSRLYKRLVHDDRLASGVSSDQQALELAGIFSIDALAKPGVELHRIEAAIDEELKRFLRKGPTRAELTRIKNSFTASLIRGLEKVGGFSGKAQLLARYEVYTGDAGNYKHYLKWIQEATPKQVLKVARHWLSSGDYNLEVLPQPKYSSASTDVDRSKLPLPDGFPSFHSPNIETFKLDNGLSVWLVRHGDLPLVRMTMQFRGGFSSDPRDKLGLASITADMLVEGSKNMDALQLAKELETLGASISSDAYLEQNALWLSAMTAELDASLKLYSRVLQTPTFEQTAFERQHSNFVNRIQREQKRPFSMALRRLPKLLYSEEHPYAIPFTGSGYIETLNNISTADLRHFYQANYQPGNAILLVVGNISRGELQPLLNKHLGSWKQSGRLSPRGEVPEVELSKPMIYLIDKPESPQSLVLAGHLLPAGKIKDDQILNMAIRILGGTFNARINMNLREDKHWSYGARALRVEAQEQQPLIYYASVQKDKTTESMLEILKEVKGYIGKSPATFEELDRNRQGILAQLPGRFETASALLEVMSEMASFGRSMNYIDEYQKEMRSMNLRQVQQSARQHLTPGILQWVIIGDLKDIEAPIRAMNLAPVKVLKSN